MKRGIGLSILAVAALLAVGSVAAQPSGHTLLGNSGSPAAPPFFPEGTEVLFQGDLVPEIGIGCSNGAGTSGGPNELAVGVTATALPAPFDVTSVFYNLFTQISPTITSLSFVGWAGGASPGAAFDTQTGMPFTAGNHTVAIPFGSFTVPSAAFYFGLQNTQTNVGFRVGVDTNFGSAGTSYIRAATCGAATFLTLDSLGFPGNWVMSATVEDAIPVELTAFDVQ